MDGSQDNGKGNRALAVIGALTGIAALVVTIAALVVTIFFDYPERRATPEAQVIVTPELRVAQAERSGGVHYIAVYVQASFVGVGLSQRTQVFHPVSLLVKKKGEDRCERFRFDQIGHFVTNSEGTGVVFNFDSDAVPLTVTHESPVDGVFVFRPPGRMENPYFVGEHATYTMTLVAERTTGKEEEAKTFRRTIKLPNFSQRDLENRVKKLAETGADPRNMFLSYINENIEMVETNHLKGCSADPS
jgi:hypothetical protein